MNDRIGTTENTRKLLLSDKPHRKNKTILKRIEGCDQMGIIPAYFLPIEINGEQYVRYSSYKKDKDDDTRTIDKLTRKVYELEEEKRKNKLLEGRYQSDCITINQLQTTIDVLVDKLARLREVHGL